MTPPALPAGWTATNAVDPDMVLWQSSNSGLPAPPADSLPNAAWVNDPAVVSDKRLDSPPIAITSNIAQVTFRNNYNLEASPPSFFDGGVLEISIGGGAFTDVIAAGGSFVAGGYTGTISTGFSNPLAGRPAWSGNSAGFITTTVNLPAAAAGQNVVLRWRMGSDTSTGVDGWRIDNVVVSQPGACPAGSPTPTATATATSTPTRDSYSYSYGHLYADGHGDVYAYSNSDCYSGHPDSDANMHTGRDLVRHFERF